MDDVVREYPISSQDWLVEVVYISLVMLYYRGLPSTSLNRGGLLFFPVAKEKMMHLRRCHLLD